MTDADSYRRYNQSEKAKARRRRYLETDKGREARRRWNARNNPRRVRVGDMYLGMSGFTVSEREELQGGASQRPRRP